MKIARIVVVVSFAFLLGLALLCVYVVNAHEPSVISVPKVTNFVSLRADRFADQRPNELDRLIPEEVAEVIRAMKQAHDAEDADTVLIDRVLVLEDRLTEIKKLRKQHQQYIAQLDVSILKRVENVKEPYKYVPWNEDPTTLEDMRDMDPVTRKAFEESRRAHEEHMRLLGELMPVERLFWAYEVRRNLQLAIEDLKEEEELILEELDELLAE